MIITRKDVTLSSFVGIAVTDASAIGFAPGYGPPPFLYYKGDDGKVYEFVYQGVLTDGGSEECDGEDAELIGWKYAYRNKAGARRVLEVFND